MFDTLSAGPSPAGSKHAHYEPWGSSSPPPPSSDHCLYTQGVSIPSVGTVSYPKILLQNLKLSVPAICRSRIVASVPLGSKNAAEKFEKFRLLLSWSHGALGIGYTSGTIPSIRGILSITGYFSPH